MPSTGHQSCSDKSRTHKNIQKKLGRGRIKDLSKLAGGGGPKKGVLFEMGREIPSLDYLETLVVLRRSDVLS